MLYVICKRQKGEGCGYTIGCGMVYSFVDFGGPPEDAIRHFGQQVAYPEGPSEFFALRGEMDLEEVWVIPAGGARKLDLDGLRKEHAKRELRDKQAATDARDLEEYERLRRKYGGQTQPS